MSNVRRLDHGCIEMVSRMQRNGIAIDIPHFQALSSKLARLMEEEYANIRSIIPREALELFINDTVVDEIEPEPTFGNEGEPAKEEPDASVININSPEQLADLLFTHMGLGKSAKLKSTKDGKRLSTGKKNLEMIRDEDPIIAAILRYREYAKLKTTYVDKMPRIAVWHPESKTWRIHCQLMLTRTETGRMASKRPNLQNIPAKSALGGEVRAGFISADGKVLLSRDLSQIELRVLAHEANEPNMIDIFRRDGDIHVETTLRAYNLTWEDWKLMASVDCECGHSSQQHDPEENNCLVCKCHKHSGKKKQAKLRAPIKCFHPDTEVLTRTGWKKILMLSPNEEIMQAIPGLNCKVDLEWVVPTEVYSGVHPSGELFHLHNEGMDLRVTPDHRMLGWGNNGKPATIMPISMNTTPRYWANAGMSSSGWIEIDETLLRLAVALQADGTITEWKQVNWGFYKQRKIDRLRALLEKAGIPYNQTTASNGSNPDVTLFHLKKVDSAQLINLLEDKKLPWWWLDLTSELREAVLEEAAYWDSTIISKHYSYFSVPHINIDVLQALAAITNRKSRAVYDKPNNGGKDVLSTLTVRSRATSRAGSLDITKIPFTDEVACLSVPSTWILVRDGGVPIIVGQSTNFGIVYGLSGLGLQQQLASQSSIYWTEQEADAFIDKWFSLYPGVRGYMDAVYAMAYRHGLVYDMFGRVRMVPGVRSVHSNVQSAALREAGNFPVQSAAAGILKTAIRHIEDITGPIFRDAGIYIEPLLQIHDELLYECDEDYVDCFSDYIGDIMNNAVPLKVPLKSEASWGKRWEK